MSAIAGIYSRRGAPIDSNVLLRISRSMRLKAPDGEALRSSEGVSMIYRPFHLDAGWRQLVQPCVKDAGMICMGGRVDNLNELVQGLDVGPEFRRNLPEVVWASYQRRGIGALGAIVGDFALALWDARRRIMVLATDSLGHCPLYFRLTPDFLYWASEARPLLEAEGERLQPDEEYVADFIINRSPAGKSPYLNVQAVPAAQAVIVSGEGEGKRRYWSFDPRKEIRYRSDDEYAEHCREIFRRAVACRMQTQGPVFSELSGGVDSSSIVCMGDRILKRGGCTAGGLNTVSYVYDDSQDADESAYIREVEIARGRRSLRLSNRECPILTRPPEGLRPDHPTTRLCYLSRHDRLAEQMHAQGARVILSGIGGDPLFWSELPRITLRLGDLLVQRRLVQLVQACSHYSKLLRVNFLRTFWEGALQPLLPPQLQGRSQFNGQGLFENHFFEAGFASRTRLKRRFPLVEDDLGFPLPSSAYQHYTLLQMHRPFALQMCTSRFPIESRHPFLDRRLLEFSLAIPLSQKINSLQTRAVFRRAMKGILPESIRTRRDKAGPTEAFQRRLSRWPSWLAEMMAKPRVCEYGYVDRAKLRNAMRSARHGVGNAGRFLSPIFALEIWLRSLDAPRDCMAEASNASTQTGLAPIQERSISHAV